METGLKNRSVLKKLFLFCLVSVTMLIIIVVSQDVTFQLLYSTQLPQCAEMPLPRITNDWQTIVFNDTYIYSAFIEKRYPHRPHIRVFGLQRRQSKSRLFCHVWYNDGNFEIVGAENRLVRYYHDRPYSDHDFNCYLHKQSLVPYAVTIVSHPCQQSENATIVQNAFTSPPPKKEFAFVHCSAPLYGPFSFFKQLTEFIEVSRYFGVNKFAVYNLDINKEVMQMLLHYVERGVVDLIPYALPQELHPEEILHMRGQELAMKDCSHRYMYRTSYTVYADSDEIIVPKNATSWMQMLSHIDSNTCKGMRDNIGAYMFQNVFVDTSYPDDKTFKSDSLLKMHPLNTLLKTRREHKIYNYKLRSKLICIPERIEYLMIHEVYTFAQQSFWFKYQQCYVNPDDSLLFHYKAHRQPHILDRRMHAFAGDIIKRIASFYNETQ